MRVLDERTLVAPDFVGNAYFNTLGNLSVEPRAGLLFVDLPFSGPRASTDQVRTFAALLARHDGKVVAFCKSGMRSALLWAATAVAQGRPIDEVLAAARRAGQNLESVTDVIVGLAKAARD